MNTKNSNNKKIRNPRSAIRIGFIGFGRMGSALAQGAVQANVLKAAQIIVFDEDAAARARAKKIGMNVAGSVRQAATADYTFLCVKPQQMGAVLPQLSGLKSCFVSVAAGITIARLEKALGPRASVFRVMPNTPALLRAGMSVLSRGRRVSTAQEKVIRGILEAVGTVAVLPESKMDAVTAVSGSGPAYAFYLAEAMIAAAKKLGIPSETARTLVHQTIFGAGQMLKSRTESAEQLRIQVTSPGGTTAAAIAVMDKKNLKSIVVQALQSAARRSKELATS